MFAGLLACYSKTVYFDPLISFWKTVEEIQFFFTYFTLSNLFAPFAALSILFARVFILVSTQFFALVDTEYLLTLSL